MSIVALTNLCSKIYIALLKFDFFFFLGFTVQFVVVVVDVKDVEFALTIAAIPVTILILVMAGYFTRKESLSGMIAIIVSISGLESRGRRLLTLLGLDPLLRRVGLLPLQARPNVSTHPEGQAVYTCSQKSHFFRGDHNRSDYPHHHQRHRVRLKFQARIKALYRESKSGKRR